MFGERLAGPHHNITPADAGRWPKEDKFGGNFQDFPRDKRASSEDTTARDQPNKQNRRKNILPIAS